MEAPTITLAEFCEVRLFKASDTPGNGWSQIGDGGVLRLSFIIGCIAGETDNTGWGKVTYHNQLTGACGLNFLVVPNFVILPSKDWAGRVTFKALSKTIGSNGKKSMYSVELDSEDDANLLCYLCEVVQLAASRAKDGCPITAGNDSAPAVVAAQMLFGSEQEAIRQRIKSRLFQLAEINSIGFTYARGGAVTREPQKGAGNYDYKETQSVEGDEAGEADQKDMNEVGTSRHPDDDGNDSDLESPWADANCAPSQQWMSAFPSLQVE